MYFDWGLGVEVGGKGKKDIYEEVFCVCFLVVVFWIMFMG